MGTIIYGLGFVLKGQKVEFAPHLLGLRFGPRQFPTVVQGLVRAWREMNPVGCFPVYLIQIHLERCSQKGH